MVTTTYTYDANGNRVGRVRVEEAGDDREAHETTYRYDREDRLLEVTVVDGDDDEAHEAEMVLLAYDGPGRRLVWESIETDHEEDHDEATRVEYLLWWRGGRAQAQLRCRSPRHREQHSGDKRQDMVNTPNRISPRHRKQL